jgi:hypothetical protein
VTRSRLEAGRFPDDRRREAERNPREPRQRARDRRLAHAEVIMVGLFAQLGSSDARAAAQPQRREPEHRGQLVFVEADLLAESVHEPRSDCQWIGRVQHHVRNRYREVGDAVSVPCRRGPMPVMLWPRDSTSASPPTRML